MFFFFLPAGFVIVAAFICRVGEEGVRGIHSCRVRLPFAGLFGLCGDRFSHHADFLV